MLYYFQGAYRVVLLYKLLIRRTWRPKGKYELTELTTREKMIEAERTLKLEIFLVFKHLEDDTGFHPKYNEPVKNN